MSLFAKIRVVTLAASHDLLDKAIDLNSPSILKQYVRDLEDAQTSLSAEAGAAAGMILTIQRQVKDAQHSIETKTASIKILQASANPNKDVIIRGLAAEAVTSQKVLEQRQQELTEQQTTSTNLDLALSRLNSKHTEMVNSVRRLESMHASTLAKEHASTALSHAASVASAGGDVSVDDIVQKEQKRSDAASVNFDRSMNSGAFAENAEQATDVDAFLANLK